MDCIRLEIPSKPQYVSTLRLVTASIAQQMNFDVEAVDDLRVCVSEAVNYLLENNETLQIVFQSSEEELTICIQASLQEDEKQDLHRMILESLLDEVIYQEKEMILRKKHR